MSFLINGLIGLKHDFLIKLIWLFISTIPLYWDNIGREWLELDTLKVWHEMFSENHLHDGFKVQLKQSVIKLQGL